MSKVFESKSIIIKVLVGAALVVGVGVLSVYFYYKPYIFTRSNNVESEELSEVKSVFSEKLKPVFADPVLLKIDNTNIQVDLLPLGVDENGVLETPKDWNKGGWYKKSSQPGEAGNMIINAHYDDNRGMPAAFWELKNVNTGDKVSVTDSFGKVYSYVVTDKFFVSINDPERLKVLESDDENKATMTLITCGGVWVSGKSTYDKRLVVKAELSNSF